MKLYRSTLQSQVLTSDKQPNMEKAYLSTTERISPSDEISTKKTRNLSAIGSINAPNLEGFFCFLANVPSIASDNAPKINKITAINKIVFESKQSKIATVIANINLLKVTTVAILFI